MLKEGIKPLDTELVSKAQPMWVLATKPEASAWITNALKCWTIFPVLSFSFQSLVLVAQVINALDTKLAASSDVENKCINSFTLAPLPSPYSLKGEWKSAFLPVLILFLQYRGRVWEAESLQTLWKSQDICPTNFHISKFVLLSNIKGFFF